MSDDDIQLVAQMLGATSAQLKQIDRQIVSESVNLKRNSWNPTQILKQHLAFQPATQVPVNLPPNQPVSVPAHQAPPAITSSHNIALPAILPVGVSIDIFDKKLATIDSNIGLILEKLKNLESINAKLENVLGKTLTHNVRQVTIKLNESKD